MALGPLALLPYPFDATFMERALVAGLVVGVFAPIIGTFLVQKRMALIGDGIGHLAFAGVGAGLLVGVWPLWGALVLAVGGAIAVERMRARRKASGDLALAWIFYTGIALGVVLVGLAGSLNANLFSYLFGQVLLVTGSELALIVPLGIVVTVVVLVLRRPLLAVVTDEDWARVAGLPVDLLNMMLAVLTAVAIVTAMRVVGILLVAALMVLPVASGQLLARSFRGTMAWSVGIGIASVVGGLAISRLWGFAPGGTIVLLASAVFAVVALTTSRRPDRAIRAIGLRVDEPAPQHGSGHDSDVSGAPVLGDSQSD
ncbi:MAG: metal ABC transporter permease [Actinomycetota bacterium]